MITVWKKGMVEVEDLKRSLDLGEERLKSSVDLLVKFGFVEFNEAEGRITIPPNIKPLLDDLQSDEIESDI